jgi:hypothetical protein
VRTFRVKNFEKFQHYKDRAPPWIKLYNELLDDYEFGLLPDASKMHLVAIWLLASRSENKIPFDPAWVGKRINATEKVNLALLEAKGFLVVDQELQTVEQDASNTLAKCLSREREETEGETEQRRGEISLRSTDDWPTDFGDQFWQAYPRKTEKLAAMKKLASVRKSGVVTFVDLMAGVQRYAAARTEPKFTKQPTTWLNAGCWADETQPAGAVGNGRRTVHDAAKDLTRTLQRLAEFDEPAPGGVCIEEGGTPFRLLPPR